MSEPGSRELNAELTERNGRSTLSSERPFDIRDIEIPKAVLRKLPVDFVKENRVLPISCDEETLRIATSDASRESVFDDIRLLTGLEVDVVEAPEDLLVQQISEFYQVTVEQMVEDLGDADGSGGLSTSSHDIEVMANEPTVVNLVNVILSTGLRYRASDIHVVPFENRIDLRYRIDGILQERPPPPRNLHAALISRIKIMADMDIAERYLPQDGHIQINTQGRRVDIRVGTMPTVHGESAVLRLLEKDNKLSTPRELGLDEERVKVLDRLVSRPHGLFLTTGPTGSGKTTTLYSVLSSTYTPTKKMLTIEDPVEYELDGVAQIPVRPARGFTFATGLRAILRQDPDVVMVGEIRDSETADIAVRAALTGHQVFSTLHTNDAAGAVTRLIDMGVEPFLISSCLEGVLAQRLVRRICPHCRGAYTPSVAEKEEFEAFGAKRVLDTYYRGAGCEECNGLGYTGRMGVFELLAIEGEIREMIVERRSSGEIKAAAVRQIKTIRQDAISKAEQGLTTIEEVLRVASGDDSE